LKRYLQDLGATVLDWQTDFTPAESILNQIQQAARRCGASIFLFTRDDALVGEETAAAPRDNVVFEAGYFSAARSKQRVLIVREKGTKMPADLGGDIYACLEDCADIGAIEPRVRRFLDGR
jgi:predicted nucleotide-binding protein